MEAFEYKGKDKQGNLRVGIIEASDIKQAANTLREHGIFVINLKRKSEFKISSLITPFKRASDSDIVNFTRQLSTMVMAGLPLTDALTILRNQTSTAMSSVIGEILRDVEGGSNLASSMEKKPHIFSKIYVALIRAGEAAGVLDQVLIRLADTLEKQRDFKSKTKGALVYPVIVIVAMVIVAFIMMIFVIPKLTVMYKDLGAELPTPTKILIAASNFSVSYWWIILIMSVVGFFSYSNFKKTPFGRRTLERFTYNMPVFGPLKKEITLAEFTRTLSLLSSAGIPIVDSLNIVSEGMDSAILADGVKDAAHQVEKGFPLASSFETNNNFPPILSQMIRVGEETGKVDDVLKKLSIYFENESENLIKGLTTAMEPIIMVILGIGVGFLILAVILPIYKLTTSF